MDLTQTLEGNVRTGPAQSLYDSFVSSVEGDRSRAGRIPGSLNASAISAAVGEQSFVVTAVGEEVDVRGPAAKILGDVERSFAQIVEEAAFDAASVDGAPNPIAAAAEYKAVLGRALEELKAAAVAPNARPAHIEAAQYAARRIKAEVDTWTIAEALFKDRLDTMAKEQGYHVHEIGGDVNVAQLLSARPRMGATDKEVAFGLFDSDASVRHLQIAIDWLERLARESRDEGMDKAQYYLSSVSWEHTLKARQMAARGAATARSKTDFITEFDPDAPFRQGAKLHDDDKEDEQRLARDVFALIRSGQMAEAINLCRGCGQGWRAAALAGWRPYHDHVMAVVTGSALSDDDTPPNIEGNLFRDVWKASCRALARSDAVVSVEEKASFASLCGDLAHILPACRSWEDELWARLRSAVESRVDRELASSSLVPRVRDEWVSVDADGGFFEDGDGANNASARVATTFDAIFSQMRASGIAEVRQAIGGDVFRRLQEGVLRNDAEFLAGEVIALTETPVSGRQEGHPFPPNTDMAVALAACDVRFAAHLVLFLRAAGVHVAGELEQRVLHTYVDRLIASNGAELVAPYASRLNDGVDVYASFLSKFTDSETRRLLIDRARKCGMDTAHVTLTLVETVKATPVDVEGSVVGGRTVTQTEGAEVTAGDMRKIDALEWLCFDLVQRGEVVRQGNALMRAFLAAGRMKAAEEVFARIPEDSVGVVEAMYSGGDATVPCLGTSKPPRIAAAVREYLSFQSYFAAHAAFSEWFDHFHRAPQQLGANGSSRDMVGEMHAMHQRQVYETESERWRATLDELTDATVQTFYNVLLFPEGWMSDGEDYSEPESHDDEMRLRQLELLRRDGIPYVCFLLHKVLHDTLRHRACVSIADIVADEYRGLYKCFDRSELQRLLSLIRESALEILGEECADPLGYGAATGH
eukprot:Opistho-2@57496